MIDRPYTCAILAVSLDGKITTAEGGPPRFASKTDKRHLMEQRARADAVILGGASVRNENPRIVIGRRFAVERARRGQSPQPMVAVVSASGDLGRDPRFLQTTGELRLYTLDGKTRSAVPKLKMLSIHPCDTDRDGEINLRHVMKDLARLGVRRLQCEGGGELVQRMLRLGLIDELMLTLCPVVIGGRRTPSAAGHEPFSLTEIRRFQLVEQERIRDELYLRYRLSSHVR